MGSSWQSTLTPSACSSNLRACIEAALKENQEFCRKSLKFGLQLSEIELSSPPFVHTRDSRRPSSWWNSGHDGQGSWALARLFCPPSPDIQGRDKKGSTAYWLEALPGVVTAAIRVVRPPHDKSRSVPVRPVGRSGTVPSKGGTPHSESRRKHCEVAERIATIPICFRRK
jgi:hypothetical protein